MNKIKEEGKWDVINQDGDIYLLSSDFHHDAMLEISGDFKDKEERHLYAHEIARRLNQFCIK